MKSTLIFPDGVRLATREELPGPETERALAWAQIEQARIDPGFVLHRAEGQNFKWYAEGNIDAPGLWAIFNDLCRTLLGSEAELLLGDADDESRSLGYAGTSTILAALERHEYQLTHDGFLKFGLGSVVAGELNEVFVVPTKHLQVWFSDETHFRSIMAKHGVVETDRLEFLDQYPRTTNALPVEKGVIRDLDELATLLEHLE